ncbi:inner membrane protein YphA [Variibacter gotjawalensis]|uniref:Inner membrane protein YphA n=1 Tax=Variibacter gotjawalensis TaxID=1333996 RepID=A0A0S3PY90_9BRAD|nr:DoxX family protein [Variibacter gotjawalensis]NIK46758.1 putative oxidoreductase [Variibacter gotjawalensis]RZS48662.1 putative oxidoreductase [Variibacter gotjawalensis]BAT60922.1 inner membrane protein YphA [Variibacter gotjawalensis]
MNDLLYAIGRALIPIMFIHSGWGKLMAIERTVAAITSKGLPQPTVLAWVVAIVELVGGVMVLVGFKTRYAALALLVFTAIATYYFHNFWALSGDAVNLQRIMALKNLAVMGALLMLIANGSGRFSVDRR